MTFAALMPHIAAGRVAQRGNVQLRIRAKVFEQRGAHHPDSPWGPVAVNADMALADDWELVEEPVAVEHFECKRHGFGCGCRDSDMRATIASLERELTEAREYAAKHGHDADDLRRELAEARKLPAQCKRPHTLGAAWICTLPRDHQGSHANSFGSWRE